MAEWIAPELNPVVRPVSRARYGFYAAAFAAAAIIICLVVVNADAIGFTEGHSIQRASGWAW